MDDNYRSHANKEDHNEAYHVLCLLIVLVCVYGFNGKIFGKWGGRSNASISRFVANSDAIVLLVHHDDILGS